MVELSCSDRRTPVTPQHVNLTLSVILPVGLAKPTWGLDYFKDTTATTAGQRERVSD